MYSCFGLSFYTTYACVSELHLGSLLLFKQSRKYNVTTLWCVHTFDHPKLYGRTGNSFPVIKISSENERENCLTMPLYC